MLLWDHRRGWAEHLTSLPKRGVSTHVSAFKHQRVPMHVYRNSMPKNPSPSQTWQQHAYNGAASLRSPDITQHSKQQHATYCMCMMWVSASTLPRYMSTMLSTMHKGRFFFWMRFEHLVEMGMENYKWQGFNKYGNWYISPRTCFSGQKKYLINRLFNSYTVIIISA